jgi:hypothetical protein
MPQALTTKLRSVASAAARQRHGFPLDAALVGLGLFVVLGWFAGADPIRGITFSTSPFTDEGFNFVNARNFVQLGRWSTDEWNLYLVNLPFSVVMVAAFKLIGVGIVQARLAMIACTSLTAALLVWGLRGAVGRWAALLAGLTFGCSGLVLFYGRLAYLEDFVGLALTLGVFVLVRDNRLGWRWGVLSGLCFALAIGTKPNAAFSTLGILIALAIARGWRIPALRRWLVGAAATIVVGGLVWAVVIWLPNQKAIATDIRIWNVYQFTLSPGTLARRIGSYAAGNNDHLYGYLLAPALALAAAGAVAIVVLRRRLTPMQARLAIAAFGWAAFGFGTLMLVTYRPNRYVVPLVPAMAILAAVGLNLAAGWLRERLGQEPQTKAAAAGDTPKPVATTTAADGSAARPTARPTARRLAVPVAAALVFVAAAGPGLAWYAHWARGATYDLPAIQDQFARYAPANTEVAGGPAAILLMKSKSSTVITGNAAANAGDLYAKGVRWYLVRIDAGAPIGVPADVWSARRQMTCAAYEGATQCLYRLP